MCKKVIVYFSILSIIISLNGCGLYKFKDTTSSSKDKVEIVVSDVEGKIIDSLKDASKEDCILIYKIFSGCASYVEKSTKLSTTLEVFKLIGTVEKDYGWNNEKYKDLTDVIEKDLTEKGFQKPQELTSEVKNNVIKTLKGYSEAVRKATLKKT